MQQTGVPSAGSAGLKFGHLAVAMVLGAAVALAIGGWPTYLWMGRAGLIAAGVGTGAVVLVMLGSGAAVLGLFRSAGPLAVGQVFVAGAVVRIVFSLGLAFGARMLWDLPLRPLLVWVAIAYSGLLLVEVGWLYRGLGRGRRA